jgi:hypothetical protein
MLEIKELSSISGYCTLRQRNQLPSQPGIYIVTDVKDRLLYIGKTTNLKHRWAGSSHHRYKQLSRQGLDKVTLYYILAPILELDKLEKEYINLLTPTLNDSRVKEYLPKKSPRFSELQRLLKLTNQPLFPSCQHKFRNGQTVLREPCDLLRGFIAGVYEDEKPHILVICQQNMGQIIYKSLKHRTKKRFYLPTDYETIPGYRFDIRQGVVIFIELFDCDWAEAVFEAVYPDLVESQFAGVYVKQLQNLNSWNRSLKDIVVNYEKPKQAYLLGISKNLTILPSNYTLNQDLIW